MSRIELLGQGTKRTKKVAFLRFHLDTLGENFIYEEAEGFRDYTPFVFCGVAKYLDKNIAYYCHKEFVKLYHPEFQWPDFPETQKSLYLSGIAKYKNILKKQRIRLLHAQFLTDAFFCLPLIKELNLPLVVSLRGYDLFHPNVKYFLPAVMPFVSQFLVKSESMKTAMTELGCDPERIRVVYGGVNTDKIIFKPRIPTEDNIKILSAGRFTEKKGFDTTLNFFSRVLNAYPGAELTLIGDGDLKDDLGQQIARLGIASKVMIKRYLPHSLFIKELYKHNLFVLPSQTAIDGNKEGIPNVLKEAMASGMPVISTYHSGIPELITDAETGYLVNERDDSGMLDKVKGMLSNREKVFQICLNARFYVENYFHVKKTAAEIESVYDQLLMPAFVRSAINVKEGRKPSQFRMDLHLSKGCNSKCIMCGNWKTDLWTSYSRADVSRLLDQLREFGIDQVRFHGQEPTLMKDIFEIIAEAKIKGFRVGLKTNALIFSNQEKVKKLGRSLDDLYLSIDSSHEAMHNLMRGNDKSFSRNVFLAQQSRLINPDLKIYINAVVTNRNFRRLAGLLDLAVSLNADRVSFVHLAYKNDDIKKLKLSKEQFEEFCFQVWPRILKKSQDCGIPVNLEPYFMSLLELPVNHQISKLTSTPQDFAEEVENFLKGQYGKKFYSQYPCYGVLDHGTIDWDGNVYPCCAMPRPPESAIGNIHEKSFDEIWNSDAYVKYREGILKGECRFQQQCSRAFKKTIQYYTYLEPEKQLGPDLYQYVQNQYKDNKYVHRYRLDKMIYYAFSRSKIYRKKFEDFLNTKNWKFDTSALPFITRDELKNFFPDEDVVPNYFDEDHGIYRTSSCGSAAFLYARPLAYNAFERMAVSFMHTGQWKARDPWVKITSINCIESQYPLKIHSSVRNMEQSLKQSNVIPASDDFLHEPVSRIRDIYEIIKSSKASLIHTNPSHLMLLLHRFQKENIKLSGRYAVHSTYELLLPSTKKLIKRYLDCRIFNQYGCSEVGPLAFTCTHGNNHIFSDTVHVDVIPDPRLNRPDVGRVVVTHLDNHVMPFVKYFNGDFAYILKDQQCPCGLKTPLMGDIVGRENQIISYNGKVVFPIEIDGIFDGLDNLLMYQVCLEEGLFLVKVVPGQDALAIDEQKIIDRFQDFFGGRYIPIRIENFNAIMPKRHGKYFNVIVK